MNPLIVTAINYKYKNFVTFLYLIQEHFNSNGFNHTQKDNKMPCTFTAVQEFQIILDETGILKQQWKQHHKVIAFHYQGHLRPFDRKFEILQKQNDNGNWNGMTIPTLEFCYIKRILIKSVTMFDRLYEMKS